ncbi:MAG: LPS-assembly protein LptD [Vicinamibacterales bacterium]
MLRHTPLVLFLALVALAAAARPAAAQLLPGWNAKQFTLERLDADRVRLGGQVEIVGEGPNAGQQIFADTVEWNLTTGEFVAEGNVVVSSAEARISAERVTFNTRTRLGTFHTASGIASLGDRAQQDISMFGSLEPDVYFYGRTIEKIGPDKYRLHQGGFTTCVQPTPRWEMVSSTATIDIGDYAVLKNAVLRVKDVPLFYLPFLYYPIQGDGRATGFLMPSYGTSTFRGQSISNAFFWAINRSQDVTLFHDWYLKTGQGAGGEYRYTTAPGSEGQLRAYWLNEHEAEFSRAGVTTTRPASRSYEVRGSLTQSLPANLRARARVDYFSSITTQQLYNNNIYDASRRQRTINGSVSGTWSNLTLTGTFLRNELFLSDTQSLVNGNAPLLNANVSSFKLAPLPVFLSLTSEASKVLYLERNAPTGADPTERDRGLARFDLLPTLRAPLTNLPFLSVNVGFSFRLTHFSQSLDDDGVQVAVPLTRRYAEMRADLLGPTFSRVFSPGNGFADRLKHIIEPSLSVSRTTNIDNQDQVVTIGNSQDVVYGGATRFNYALTNRVLIRKAAPPATAGAAATQAAAATAPREFLTVALTQSYYTDARASQTDLAYQSSGLRPPSKFSPVALVARTAPTALSDATLRLEYNHEDHFIQSISASGSMNYPIARVTAGWSSRRQVTGTADNALNTSTTLQTPDGRIGGTYSFNWDITRGVVLQQRWIGNYAAQCCGFAIEYQQYNFPGSTLYPVPQDRRFNFTFTLAGLGTFSNFFGSFGGQQR